MVKDAKEKGSTMGVKAEKGDGAKEQESMVGGDG